MADDESTPATDDDATATSAAGASPEAKERTFSQAEVDAIVARRVSKAEKSAEKRLRQELDHPPKKETPPAPGSDDLASRQAALEQKLAVAEALGELDWKPSKDDAEILRDAFKSGGQAAFDKLAGRLKPAAAATAEAKTMPDTPTYKSPGAPAGAPPEVLETDATKWPRDYVERLRSEGSLLTEVEKYRSSLPGGGGGLFRKRIPQAR